MDLAKLLKDPPASVLDEAARKQLLADAQLPETLNHQDYLGATPLHWAASAADWAPGSQGQNSAKYNVVDIFSQEETRGGGTSDLQGSRAQVCFLFCSRRT